MIKIDPKLDRDRLISVLRENSPEDLSAAAQAIVKAQGGKVTNHTADILTRSYAAMAWKAP
jgi:hypothetical protein